MMGLVTPGEETPETWLPLHQVRSQQQEATREPGGASPAPGPAVLAP